MRPQLVIYRYGEESKKFGKYYIEFVKPAAAQVELVSYTKFPAEVMYVATRAYKGIYTTDNSTFGFDADDYEGYTLDNAFEDIQRTKLQTPLEMVHMMWLFNDVTRAFTHQLVRYRVGTAFIQESMRFLGMKNVFKVLVTHEAANLNYVAEAGETSVSDPNFNLYAKGAIAAIQSYVNLLDRGVHSEDARGVLPTNILTSIYFDCSLRTLQGIFPQRLCCQAQQGEWQPILLEMRKLIKEKMGPNVESVLRAPYERGEDCGYRASFDRPCVWNKEKE